MNDALQVKIWLKDGSILKDWTLTQTDIKVSGLAFDIHTFAKLDDAYLYVSDGTQVYRDRVTGTIDAHGPGVTGSLKVAIEQIEQMVLSTAAAKG
jgi:hypothetical protein